MAHDYEEEEKPFDPERRYPREVSPHHFAVNAGSEYARRHIILPEEVVNELFSWHGGQFTPTYRLASIGMEDYVSQSMIRDAINELDATFSRTRSSERDELRDLIGTLDVIESNPDEFSVEASGIETPDEWEYDKLYEEDEDDDDDDDEVDGSELVENAMCPVGTQVETLLFPVDDYSRAQAKSWARGHGFKYGKVDTTDDYHRLRQRDPRSFKKGSFRTIMLPGDAGVKAVVGCPKK